MNAVAGSGDKRMRLRYEGRCRICRADLPAGTEAIYERNLKTVRCLAHEATASTEFTEDEAATTDPGIPGASARREFERRVAKREEKVRAAHPKLGGFILAVSDDPQSTRAWDVGALGEERLGGKLNEIADEKLRPLHDRRIRGSRANIDHIAVTPTGIYVIDAKKYKGRPSLKIEGGILRPRVERLLVGTRDCTKLVDGVLKQTEVVRGVIGDEVPNHGVLCFVEADWPLIGGSFRTRGVEVLWPKKLYSKLKAEGLIGVEQIAELHRRLAEALPASRG